MMAQLLILLVSLSPILIFVGALLLLSLFRSKKTRLPFSVESGHRVAGYSLLRSYNDMGIDGFSHVLTLQMILFMPFIAYGVASWLDEPINMLVYLIIVPAAFIYIILKAWRIFRDRAYIRLGLEAEWFVATQLAELSESGYRVYHDIQAEGFNIDHLVVGPNGVFAIETKGRRKPGSSETATPMKDLSHQLDLDQDRIIFPHTTDTQMVPQAIRQAKWCSQWLTQACGMPVTVTPVLALPGWFINRKKRHAISVLSGKEIPKALPTLNGQSLTPEQREQVIWQIKQRIQRDSDEL